MSRFSSDTLERAKAFANKTTPDIIPSEAPKTASEPSKPEVNTQDAMSIVLGLCRHFEGLYLKPYLCSANVPTIGYGATFYEDGTKVTLRDAPITKERAEQLLRWHISKYFMPDVVRLCPGADTPGRIAALCDFAFNVGIGALRNSTLRRKVNAGAWDEVPAQFLRWNKAGGKVLRGLTRRRQAEIDCL